MFSSNRTLQQKDFRKQQKMATRIHGVYFHLHDHYTCLQVLVPTENGDKDTQSIFSSTQSLHLHTSTSAYSKSMCNSWLDI